MSSLTVSKDTCPEWWRLAELENTCNRLFQQRDAIVPQRLPRITTIDASVRQSAALNQENAALKKRHANLAEQARTLDRYKTKDVNEQITLERQRRDVRSSAANVSAQHASNSAEINRCAAAGDGAARELERLNGELVRCWNELEAARGSRLELFGTTTKYLRGEDAVIRDQLERWLLKDTYGVAGHFWAGLAALEMGVLDAAVDLVERGKRASSETATSLGRRASPGRLHALNCAGAVVGRLPLLKHEVGHSRTTRAKSRLRRRHDGRNPSDGSRHTDS